LGTGGKKMKSIWIIGGILASSATVFAQPNVPFSTVFDSTATFDGGSPIGAFDVVVGTGGDVFSSIALDNGNVAIIYSTPGSNTQWNSQDVVDSNTAVANVDSSGFITFDNLALSTNTAADTRLFFAAGTAVGNYGILQLDINSGSPTVSDVAFDGDGGPYSFSGSNSVINSDGTISLQVNASGQALFPANTSANSGVLVRGSAGSTTQVFTPTSSLSLTNPTFRDGIGNELPTPTSAAELTASPNVVGVYTLSGATHTLISGTLAPPQSGASMLMGYTSTSSFNAALLLGQGTGGGNTQQVLLTKNNGTQQFHILSGSDTSVTPGTDGVNTLGEISPQGQIALYVPDGTNDSDDTIQYANAGPASPGPATVVAAVDTDSSAPSYTKVALSDGHPLPILDLQIAGAQWVPQINNNGAMIFNAEVLDASLPAGNQDQQALLEWNPADLGTSPVVLLETGQPADIDGTPSSSVVDSFTFSDLIQESDFYKNAISDDNYVGLNVQYDDGSNAVIITQVAVPEPATLALLPIAGLSLLGRRRRK
jgi:hypothetical protein